MRTRTGCLQGRRARRSIPGQSNTTGWSPSDILWCDISERYLCVPILGLASSARVPEHHTTSAHGA